MRETIAENLALYPPPVSELEREDDLDAYGSPPHFRKSLRGAMCLLLDPQISLQPPARREFAPESKPAPRASAPRRS